VNLETIRQQNIEALKAYKFCNDFHTKNKNPNILVQCWEYKLTLEIEFLLSEIDKLTKD